MQGRGAERHRQIFPSVRISRARSVRHVSSSGTPRTSPVRRAQLPAESAGVQRGGGGAGVRTHRRRAATARRTGEREWPGHLHRRQPFLDGVFACGACSTPLGTPSPPRQPVEGGCTQGCSMSHEGRCGRRARHRRCAPRRPVVSGGWYPSSRPGSQQKRSAEKPRWREMSVGHITCCSRSQERQSVRSTIYC